MWEKLSCSSSACAAHSRVGVLQVVVLSGGDATAARRPVPRSLFFAPYISVVLHCSYNMTALTTEGSQGRKVGRRLM